jgi:DNA-binding MarR family transcriptional regulator
MKNKYLLLNELLPHLEDFEEAQPDGDLEIFSSWLNDKLKQSKKKSRATTTGMLESYISAHIGFLFRYAKIFSKKVLDETPFQSLDDWSYCIALLYEDSLPKMELIKKNIHEKTTGMEIIKRLVGKKLLREFVDEDDNRVKRVSLTANGRKSLEKTFLPMQQLAHHVCGNLTEEEKATLNHLMLKLHLFHFPNYVEHIKG